MKNSQQLIKNLEKLTKKNIEELLFEEKIFEAEKLQEISRTCDKRNVLIEEYLTENDLLDEVVLAKITCKNLSLPFLPLNNMNISENLAESIPHSLMKEYLIFPVSVAGEALTLAICSPPRPELVNELEKTNYNSFFFFVDLITSIQKHIEQITFNEEKNTSSAVGTTDVWETIFDKADNEIMTEIGKTHERKESPLQGTHAKKDAPLDVDVNTDVFPEEAPEQIDTSGEISSALSSVFGDEEVSVKEEISSTLSSIFGEDVPGNVSEISEEIDSRFISGNENSDDVLIPTVSKTKEQIERLISDIAQDPLNKTAVSEFVELAIANNNVEVAVEKLADYGKALIKNKEYSEAQKCYESILILDPENEEANNFLS